MSRVKKIFIIIAAIFIGVGMIMTAAALMMAGADIVNFNTRDFELKAVEVKEDFTNIDIEDVECDIYVTKSIDGICKVEFTATDGIEHNIGVYEDTLKVTSVDARKWYEHIGIFIGEEMKVTVYLPENEYESLSLNTLSGDIVVSSEFTFSKVIASSTSGDVNLSDTKAEKVTVSSTSGDVNLLSVEAKELTASSISGDVELSSVIVSGKADIKAVSGDIELDNCDADSFYIEAVSGDVDGVILSSKNFITDTTSGNVRVPASDYNAGECSITTTSGDIEIEIVQ